MSAASYNPKKNQILDDLGTAEAVLLGISSTASSYTGSTALSELTREWSRRLEQLGPREDRKAIFEAAKESLKEANFEALGTHHSPIMLAFGPDVYAAFVADAMPPEELQAFKTVWSIRGRPLASILAYKENKDWQYRLLSSPSHS